MWWAQLLNNVVALLGTSGGSSSGTAYESISTAVGTGSSAVITFSSIPSTYKHLQIRAVARRATSGGLYTMQFNSDTAANYARHSLIGDGTTASASGTASTTSIYGGYASNDASIVGATIIDILDYASTTKNKTTRVFNGIDTNGAGFVTGVVYLQSGLWNSTAAISTITITAAANFTTETQFALYGIKG